MKVKQFIVSFLLLVVLAVAAPLRSIASADTLIDRTTRAAVLDALRHQAEIEIGIPVKFVVQNMERHGDWVLIQARPVQKSGADIDYKKTPYYRKKANRDNYEFAFDDQVQALLHLKAGTWTVAEYELGATDYSGDYWIQKHHLTKLFNRDEQK